jgi:hypothetical protein
MFGLKGRFCQPRPQAWDMTPREGFGPERALRIVASLENVVAGHQLNGPFRAKPLARRHVPGLRPGLTESAFQAEHTTTIF